MPSSEDGFMKGIHCLEMMSISFSIHSQMLSIGCRSGDHAGWSKREVIDYLYIMKLFSMKKSLVRWPITTQTSAPSHERCLLQHLQIVSCCLTPLGNLKLNCFIEGKGTPDHDGAPFTLPCREHLRWLLLVMPTTLEAIRTIKVKLFLIRV